MTKLIVAGVTSLILTCASLAAANDVVEVQVIDTAAVVHPTTKPAAVPTDVLKDGKLLLSLEALTDEAGHFHAKCVSGDTTVRLTGRVTVTADDQRLLKIKFSRQSPGSVQEVGSTIPLVVNEQTAIAGLLAGKGTRFIIATVKPSPELATANAE